MKQIRRIIAVILCVATVLSIGSCADLGEGEDEVTFHKYFSNVSLLSHYGYQRLKIKTFHEFPEDEAEIEEVVATLDYCYIAFRVSSKYTLSVNDFAFFAKAKKGTQGTLILEFFISDHIPTRLKDSGDDEYTYLPKDTAAEDAAEDSSPETYAHETDENGDNIERDEVDENIFDRPGYAKTTFEITDDWDSTYLEFDQPQTVEPGHYIVLRVKNNCYIKDAETDPELADAERVSFTFNYLMFNFSNVTEH